MKVKQLKISCDYKFCDKSKVVPDSGSSQQYGGNALSGWIHVSVTGGGSSLLAIENAGKLHSDFCSSKCLVEHFSLDPKDR